MTLRSSTPEERRAVGARLRDTARAANLTSDQIAEALGVQGGSVRGWWVGRNEPSLGRLQQYAELVKVSPSYLLFGVEREMGASGTVQEVRLRLADLVNRGMDPAEAIDQILAEMNHVPASPGIPEKGLTPQERGLLSGKGPLMRRLLQALAGGKFDRLSDRRKEAILTLIEEFVQDEPEPE